jgi:hypothetical protein
MTRKLILCAALLLSSAALYAHHGNSQHYDASNPVSLDAVITSLELVNPHAYVYFEVTDENGQAVPWRCEMSAATSLKRKGWDQQTLSAGQNITINGSLARREENVCVVTSFIFENGLEVSRATNLDEYNESSVSAPSAAKVSEQERTKMATQAQPDFTGTWVAMGRNFRRAGMAAAMGDQGGRGTDNVTATAAGMAAAEGYDPNFDNPNLQCRASDIIMAIVRDQHVNEIIQGENTIELNFGYMNVERTIHMDTDTHPENIDASLEGHSIGHWGGPVLVVDTKGFLPSTYGGNGSYMTSEEMHIIERFEFDAAEGQLLRHYALGDPLYLDGTITGTDQMIMTNEPYEEYGCKELSGSNNQRS